MILKRKKFVFHKLKVAAVAIYIIINTKSVPDLDAVNKTWSRRALRVACARYLRATLVSSLRECIPHGLSTPLTLL